jgi:hypothetical protein
MKLKPGRQNRQLGVNRAARSIWFALGVTEIGDPVGIGPDPLSASPAKVVGTGQPRPRTIIGTGAP